MDNTPRPPQRTQPRLAGFRPVRVGGAGATGANGNAGANIGSAGAGEIPPSPPTAATPGQAPVPRRSNQPPAAFPPPKSARPRGDIRPVHAASEPVPPAPQQAAHQQQNRKPRAASAPVQPMYVPEVQAVPVQVVSRGPAAGTPPASGSFAADIPSPLSGTVAQPPRKRVPAPLRLVPGARTVPLARGAGAPSTAQVSQGPAAPGSVIPARAVPFPLPKAQPGDYARQAVPAGEGRPCAAPQGPGLSTFPLTPHQPQPVAEIMEATPVYIVEPVIFTQAPRPRDARPVPSAPTRLDLETSAALASRASSSTVLLSSQMPQELMAQAADAHAAEERRTREITGTLFNRRTALAGTAAKPPPLPIVTLPLDKPLAGESPLQRPRNARANPPPLPAVAPQLAPEPPPQAAATAPTIPSAAKPCEPEPQALTAPLPRAEQLRLAAASAAALTVRPAAQVALSARPVLTKQSVATPAAVAPVTPDPGPNGTVPITRTGIGLPPSQGAAPAAPVHPAPLPGLEAIAACVERALVVQTSPPQEAAAPAIAPLPFPAAATSAPKPVDIAAKAAEAPTIVKILGASSVPAVTRAGQPLAALPMTEAMSAALTAHVQIQPAEVPVAAHPPLPGQDSPATTPAPAPAFPIRAEASASALCDALAKKQLDSEEEMAAAIRAVLSLPSSSPIHPARARAAQPPAPAEAPVPSLAPAKSAVPGPRPAPSVLPRPAAAVFRKGLAPAVSPAAPATSAAEGQAVTDGKASEVAGVQPDKAPPAPVPASGTRQAESDLFFSSLRDMGDSTQPAGAHQEESELHASAGSNRAGGFSLNTDLLADLIDAPAPRPAAASATRTPRSSERPAATGRPTAPATPVVPVPSPAASSSRALSIFDPRPDDVRDAATAPIPPEPNRSLSPVRPVPKFGLSLLYVSMVGAVEGLASGVRKKTASLAGMLPARGKTPTVPGTYLLPKGLAPAAGASFAQAAPSSRKAGSGAVSAPAPALARDTPAHPADAPKSPEYGMMAPASREPAVPLPSATPQSFAAQAPAHVAAHGLPRATPRQRAETQPFSVSNNTITAAITLKARHRPQDLDLTLNPNPAWDESRAAMAELFAPGTPDRRTASPASAPSPASPRQGSLPAAPHARRSAPPTLTAPASARTPSPAAVVAATVPETVEPTTLAELAALLPISAPAAPRPVATPAPAPGEAYGDEEEDDIAGPTGEMHPAWLLASGLVLCCAALTLRLYIYDLTASMSVWMDAAFSVLSISAIFTSLLLWVRRDIEPPARISPDMTLPDASVTASHAPIYYDEELEIPERGFVQYPAHAVAIVVAILTALGACAAGVVGAHFAALVRMHDMTQHFPATAAVVSTVALALAHTVWWVYCRSMAARHPCFRAVRETAWLQVHAAVASALGVFLMAGGDTIPDTALALFIFAMMLRAVWLLLNRQVRIAEDLV
ncbi:hypothetical protein DB346_06065 [Verrucomicrobia bacterium LW23]|nr:hypothetical protein DB346_06065 [Verrucomicrobia bacterium LW23]